MQIKNEHHSFVGMQRDLSISKHPSSMLYDARNIRLTSREGDTLLAVTNERGTDKVPDILISGVCIGHCLLNEYLVVFTTDTNGDYITRVDLKELKSKQLFNGNLGFSKNHPIDTVVSYESESIQKVYWTDNNNQPRVINIVADNADYNNTSFDFIPELELNEKVTVEKLYNASGSFAPGVIQYAFTYFRKHGQESNIFFVTPLYYISHIDRGASPEDKVDNAFKITIENIDHKHKFDYIRIYSIQRTSINGTPICKRTQDIYIKDNKDNEISYTDTGYSGDSIDPTELLYKGGETVVASTIEQKDGTLFLGNIKLQNEVFDNDTKRYIKNSVSLGTKYRKSSYSIDNYKELSYNYVNQLRGGYPCAGFKRGNKYRLGVQFQYKDGRWSQPIPVKDMEMTISPIYSDNNGEIEISHPVFSGMILDELSSSLITKGYKRVRGVVVYPENKDRLVLCQGVANPTLYTEHERNESGTIYAQSSWFFRFPENTNENTSTRGSLGTAEGSRTDDISAVAPYSGKIGNMKLPYVSNNLSLDNTNILQVEIQGDFNDNNKFIIDNGLNTLHSPDIGLSDTAIVEDYSNLFQQHVGDATIDFTLSDINIQTESSTVSNIAKGFTHKSFSKKGSYGIVTGPFYKDEFVDDKFTAKNYPTGWLIYPWQRKGSLNNDINRPTGSGAQSAILKKKVISNLRYTTTTWKENIVSDEQVKADAKIFHSDEPVVIKTLKGFYKGNIDTLLSPDNNTGVYSIDGPTTYRTNAKWNVSDNKFEDEEIQVWNINTGWASSGKDIGKDYIGLFVNKDPVRMRYKSTPHIVFNAMQGSSPNSLPIIELVRKDITNIFGGELEDSNEDNEANRANVWIPCGDPVSLENDDVLFEYSWGDTYYQRYDCLKTYPFTNEDPNQIVEIGSFMLETYINIDGRYDRNRGQINNLNMSPVNFNLINPVYSQLNNFFTYRILDSSVDENTKFPSQITWTKEKQNGSDVDLWTNITLASTYDLDGSKGEIVSLNLQKDQLFCFQDKGISVISFNSRVQIPTSDGTPIEITNNYKVDGYKYISEGVGCNNKSLIKETPSGIYFLSSINNYLYHIGEGINDVTTTHNMSSLFKTFGSSIKTLMYDNINSDIYLISDTDALCFSEVLGQFTSFMDYGGISLMETYGGHVFTLYGNSLYKMFEGNYNYYFDEYLSWYFTFISNGIDESLIDSDKIFSNIDYRMDVSDTSEYLHNSTLTDIQVFNEYQDTNIVPLKNFTKSSPSYGTNLRKKFRTWRIQIPRNKGSMDRIRNTWCKITLYGSSKNEKAVLHDLNVQYYI